MLHFGGTDLIQKGRDIRRDIHLGQPWPYKLPFVMIFLNDFESPTATNARNKPPNSMRNLATFLPSDTRVCFFWRGGGSFDHILPTKPAGCQRIFRSKTEM